MLSVLILLSNMKTAYILGSLNRGGTETLMLDVCRSLQKTDFSAIGIYRKGGVLKDEFLQSGVPFYYLPVSRFYVSYLLKLRQLIKNENIEVVHAQQPIDALFVLLACIGMTTKVVLTLHGFDFSANKRLMKFLLHKTDTNIFVSEYQKKYYIKKYHLLHRKQKVIYNGIDFSKLVRPNVPVESKLRTELKIADNTLLLGMVGNFNEVRDQLTVCRFLKLLKSHHANFHFIFVGKRVESVPERYDKCVQFCELNGLKEQVSFLGVRNDVPEILPQLDAFIYSTEHDTFGIAVIEAIASGIPVFVNNWDVMKEITENGKFATLYNTEDETDLLAKIILFLQQKQQYRHKAEDNAATIREKYAIEEHIAGLKSLYKEMLYKK